MNQTVQLIMCCKFLSPSLIMVSLCVFGSLLVSISAQYSDNYIIHMDLSAMPKVFTDHHSWYLATLSSVLDNSTQITPSSMISSKFIYSYTNVINGFSANLLPQELEALKASTGYISSIKDLLIKPATTHSPKFLGLNFGSGAWPQSNFGEDVIIGVVDTGIWPESESFRDDGMSDIPSRWKGKCVNDTLFNSSSCNKKLIGVRFFNKGQRRQTNNSSLDIVGHGTLVSSIAAGNYVEGASYFAYGSGTASGIAPRARLAMYKAIWGNIESFSAIDVLAAIDQAIKDGVDILSLSFAVAFYHFNEDPIAIGTFSAMEKGIFVSAAAGNSGPYFRSVSNGLPWVLTVAGGRTDREFAGVLNLGNGVSVTGWSLYPGNASSTHIPIVLMNSCIRLHQLQGIGNKIVVCEDEYENGFSLLNKQIDFVEDAKVAAGVFITNNTKVENFIATTFPATFLNRKNGEIVKDYIKTVLDPKASFTFNITLFGTKAAPSMPSYSSRGPSAFSPSILKPDVMAPGSLILASNSEYDPVTWLNNRYVYSKFRIVTGTSFACPHAAGVAALLKSAHPEWSPAAIRSAIMTTSDIVDNNLNPIKDTTSKNQFATPLAMGAGHINPNEALHPGLVYDAGREDYINFFCACNYTFDNIKVIVRSDSFNCSTPSLDLNYPSFIAFFNEYDAKPGSKMVKEFTRTVTNVEKGRAIYVASLPSMDGFEVKVFPDKLVFQEQNQRLSFNFSIEGPSLMNETVVFGHFRWVNMENKQEVKSPIVATNLRHIHMFM